MSDPRSTTSANEVEPPQSNRADPRREKRSFHRGETVNYLPNRSDYLSKTFLQDYLLKGWMPAAPLLSRGTKITAFGSCFAAHITRHLSTMGYDLSSNRDPNIHISRIGDGMVNTAAILGQFKWALENARQPEDLWHGYKAESFGYDEEIRVRTRDVFLATEFFVITLGLSEIWYDEQTGGTFWRAVPEESFDTKRHKFRVLSVEETKSDIAEIHGLIRKHVPTAKVLFTVSPIPLAATFRPVSCLTANGVSKAIIRAALDEFFRTKPAELNSNLFYFPSMEIVQLCFVDPWGDDMRHPSQYVLDTVMKVFEAAYCVGEATLEDANEMFQMFRAHSNRELANRTNGDADSKNKPEIIDEIIRLSEVAHREAKALEHKLKNLSADKQQVKAQRKAARRATKKELGRS